MTIQAISADGVAHEFPDATDTNVIGKVMRDYAQNQLSLSGAVKGGLHDAGTAISQGMKAVGGVMARNGMPDYGGDVQSGGDWLANHTPDAPAGPSPNEQLEGAIQHGEYGRAAQVLPYAAVRGFTGAAPVLAAGAIAPEALAPLAAGAAGGAMSVGPLAYGRAANNGRSEPNTADVVGALPGAAVSGAADALLPAAKGVANPLARAGATVLRGAAGMAGQDAAGQLGASVGTDKGPQFNPYETAAAGLTGAGMGVRDVTAPVKAGVRAGTDRAVAAGMDAPASPEEASSVVRVGDLMKQRQADDFNSTGKQRPLQNYANTVKDDLAQKINGGLKELQGVGVIDAQQAQDFRALTNNQARRSNNTITSPGDSNTPSLYDKFMASSIPEAIKAEMGNDILDLNTISGNSFQNRGQGPMQSLGRVAGKYGGALYEAAQGNLPGAFMGAVFGHGIGSKVGGAIGQSADRMLGLNTPPVVLQRINAARVLRQAGQDPNAVEPTGRYSITGPASDQTQADFDTLSANDQAALDTQAERAKAQRETQVQAAIKQNTQRQKETQAAYDQAGRTNALSGATPEADAFLSGKLNDPSLLPADRPLSPEAIQALRLRNAEAMARQSSRAQQVLEQAQQAGTQRQQEAVDGSKQDAQLLAQQAATEQAQKQASIEAAWRQQAPGQPAPAVPDNAGLPPEVQAYLSGKLDDPSLLGNNRLVPGNELATQAQRISNAQALLKDRMRALKVLQKAQGAGPELDEVGNPVDTVPVNTPIPAKAPRLKVNTPADVRQAVALDDGVPPPAAPQAPVEAPAPSPALPTPSGAQSRLEGAQATLKGASGGGIGYIRRNFPDATTKQVHDAIQAAVAGGDISPETADAIVNGARVDVGALEDVKAHLRRQSTPHNEGWAVEHSQQARVNASGYQSSADQLASILSAQGQHGAAKVVLDIKQEPTIAGKVGIRDAQPPGIRAEIPEWMVKQGKK